MENKKILPILGIGLIFFLIMKIKKKTNDTNNGKFKYFTFSELMYSWKAEQANIDNTTKDQTILNNLSDLIITILDPLRETYGQPIFVNSGYRNDEVNKLVKGATNSNHKKGLAADLTTKSKDGNKKIYNILLSNRKNWNINELINENNYEWIHVSLKK